MISYTLSATNYGSTETLIHCTNARAQASSSLFQHWRVSTGKRTFERPNHLKKSKVIYPFRMHEVAPITSTRSDEIEEATLGKTQQQSKNDILVKRIGMWRAIVLSSLGKTLFPYSKYIRTLRLQDLEDLLDLLGDPKLKNLSATFFKDELASVEVKKGVKMQKKDFLVVDATKTSNRLADIVTRDTPMLEELSGNIFHSTLSQCIPRLPKLQYLILYQGEAL